MGAAPRQELGRCRPVMSRRAPNPYCLCPGSLLRQGSLAARRGRGDLLPLVAHTPPAGQVSAGTRRAAIQSRQQYSAVLANTSLLVLSALRSLDLYSSNLSGADFPYRLTVPPLHLRALGTLAAGSCPIIVAALLRNTSH